MLFINYLLLISDYTFNIIIFSVFKCVFFFFIVYININKLDLYIYILYYCTAAETKSKMD